MREIKFRSWDGKKMRTVDYLEFPLPHPGMVLMQYTGIKDEKGKEIYEGDILQGCFNDENRLTTVQWSDEWACWVVSYKEYGLSTFKYVEVIGNIYENPELMEEPA